MSESQFLENIRENQGIIFKLVGLYANDDEHKKTCIRRSFYKHGKVGQISGRMPSSAPGFTGYV
ncbi:MAG: hypothetical protein IPM42_04440 [Saprospiraceae bacterium]|nr:hypothetical protein [Saprospiraceae bacterium]